MNLITESEIIESMNKGFTGDGKEVIINGHKVIISWEVYDNE